MFVSTFQSQQPECLIFLELLQLQMLYCLSQKIQYRTKGAGEMLFVVISIVVTTNILKPHFLLCVCHDSWEYINDMSHGFTMGQVSPIKLLF